MLAPKYRFVYLLLIGAPDPTAGGALDDDNSWHLDEEQVQKLVRNYLSQGIYCNHNEHLSSIFDKVGITNWSILAGGENLPPVPVSLGGVVVRAVDLRFNASLCTTECHLAQVVHSHCLCYHAIQFGTSVPLYY